MPNAQLIYFLIHLSHTILPKTCCQLLHLRHTLNVCSHFFGELTASKRNRLPKSLEKRIVLKMNVKYYE